MLTLNFALPTARRGAWPPAQISAARPHGRTSSTLDPCPEPRLAAPGRRRRESLFGAARERRPQAGAAANDGPSLGRGGEDQDEAAAGEETSYSGVVPTNVIEALDVESSRPKRQQQGMRAASEERVREQLSCDEAEGGAAVAESDIEAWRFV